MDRTITPLAQKGIAVPQRDDDPFLSVYQQLAEAGDTRAQNALASLYLRRESENYNPVLAYQWLRRAAESGNRLAQFNLGDLYQRGVGTSKDDKQALHWFLQCVQPVEGKSGLTPEMLAWAHLKLGIIYHDGRGTPVDYSKALFWFSHIIPDHHAYAQYMVGSMYANGRGVPKDLPRAILWWQAAASQGLALAKKELASLL